MTLMDAEREYKNLIWQDADRVSGAVCFFGTRVPVQHMLDYLNANSSVEEFCQDYNIELAHARAVLSLAVHGLDSFLNEAA
jgi:uncharacterized protein (DUF433 family)